MYTYNDQICSVCERPNNLIYCSGGCLRSFHKECLGLTSAPVSAWTCQDCMVRAHHCFQCKEKDSDANLVKCTYPSCGRFFHKKEACCRWQPHLLATKPYICPSHQCFLCYRLDDLKDPLMKCFRCIRCFHRSHRPPTYHILDDKYFLCDNHRTEDPRMPSSTVVDLKTSQSPYAYQAAPSPYANAPLPYPNYGYSPAGQQPIPQTYASPTTQQPLPGNYGVSPVPQQPYNAMYGMPPAAQATYPNNYGRSPTAAVAPEPKRPKASPMTNRQLETNELKATETLLKPWSDLRRAGIELKEERIKARGVLLKEIQEKTIQQQLRTRETEEKLISDRNTYG